MKEFDFSQMEDMAQMFGIPSDMIKQMSDDINQRIQSGDIDEKEAKKLEKNFSRSTKMMNKITEKMKKKGMEMPDLSSIAGMGMPDISSLTGMEMPDLSNMDLSNVNGMDMSFIKDMDINNLTPENIAKLQEAAKDIKIPASFGMDNVFADDSQENVQLTEVLKRLMSHSVEVILQSGEDCSQTGQSRFGGCPDVWKSFEWPCCEEYGPLTFLCQINCAQASVYDRSGRFPGNGMLYFFYALEEGCMSDYGKDGFKVMYCSDPLSELSKCVYPDGYDDDRMYPEIKISFRSDENVPDYDEFMEFYNTENIDVGEEDYLISQNNIKTHQSSGNRLLGYAECIQGEMLTECELDYRCFMGVDEISYNDINDSQKEQIRECASQWTLLFELDSVDEDDTEVMFGDGGKLYFYIRKSDLEKRNFNDCIAIEQCY